MYNTINVYSGDSAHPTMEGAVYKISDARIFVGESQISQQSVEASTEQEPQRSSKVIKPLREKNVKKSISERVNNLIETAGESDWDGEGAEPVTSDLIDKAVQIVADLPSDIPMPHVSVTPLGYVALDWEDEPDLLASLVILPGGGIAFSFHSDKTRFHGQDQWEYNIGISRFLRCFVANIKPRRRNV